MRQLPWHGSMSDHSTGHDKNGSGTCPESAAKRAMNQDRQRVMAAHLESIVAASRELRHRQRVNVVTTGSSADRELRLRASDGADANPVIEAHIQGLKAVVAAEDFIGAAVDLAGRPERSFATMAVLRGAAEAAAQAFWYLDPSIGLDEREARALGGLRDAVGSARRFGRKGKLLFASEVASGLDALDEVVRVHPADARGLPTWEKLLRELGRTLAFEDRLSDAGLEALSNAAHSVKGARDQIVIEWEDDGRPVLHTHPATQWGYWYVANLFVSAVSHAALLFGWPTDEWLEDATLQSEQLQQLFNEVLAERASGHKPK